MKPDQRINYGRLLAWLETQERQYNPEHDCPDIRVTMTDLALIQTCKALLKEVKYLRKQQDAMKNLFYIRKGNQYE